MKSIMKQYPVASFFVLAYTMSWVLWVPLVLIIRFVLPEDQDPGPLMILMLLGTFSPTIAATIMTQMLEGKAGVKALWAKLLVWRVGFKWWLAAILLTPIATFGGIGIYLLLGGTVGSFDLSQWYAVLLGPIIALPFFAGEEMGWRGYAQPRLQKQYSALRSSVIVGVLWALWHAPAFWAAEGTAISGKPITFLLVGWYIALMVGLSIPMTFVYNNSKGSLLLIFLFHGMFTGANIFPLFPDISEPALDQVILYIPIALFILSGLIIARFGADHLSRQPNYEPNLI